MATRDHLVSAGAARPRGSHRLALSPFLPLLRRWSVWKVTVAVAGLYLVVGFWAAAVAAPGNIEGLVYLRPEFGPDVVLLVQPEIMIQGVAMSLLIALGLKLVGRAREVVPADGRDRAAMPAGAPAVAAEAPVKAG